MNYTVIKSALLGMHPLGITHTYYVQVLYEYVFLHGKLERPFTLLQTHPHQEIPLSRNICVQTLHLGSACVLVAVEKENSPNLLEHLDIEVTDKSSVQQNNNHLLLGGSSI